jgi:VWFA-related protein
VRTSDQMRFLLAKMNLQQLTRLGLLGLACLAIALSQIPPPDQTTPPKLQPGELPKPQPRELPKEEPPAAADQGQSTFSITRRTVLSPTTVMEKKGGSFVNGLSTSNFQLFDNGKPQQIGSDFSFQPISLVAVIEANTDVEPVLSKFKKTGVLLQGLITGEAGQTAILAFDHRVRVMQDFTNNADKLDDAMQKIKAGSSGAAMIDAVAEAARMLSHQPKENRRIILLISEDRDKGSHSTIDETVKTLEFNSVQIYAVDVEKYFAALMRKPEDPRPLNGGIPAAATPNLRGDTYTGTTLEQNQQMGNFLNIIPPVFRSVRDVFKLTPEQAFTRYTGGTTYTFAAKESTLERAIDDIAKELHAQYVLSYTPNNQSEPGFHTIKVTVDKPGLEIRTRPGYYWGGGQF